MKTQPIIKKFFRVGLTALIFSVIFLILYYVFGLLIGFKHPILAIFITLFFLVYFYEQITDSIRNFIDKNFYRKIFAITQDLNALNQDLNKTTDFSQLTGRFVKFLKHSLAEYSWAFYLKWGEEFELFEKNSIDIKLPRLINLSKDNPLKKIPKSEIDFFVLHKYLNENAELKKAFEKLTITDQIYYFYPLKSYKDCTGFLLLDRRFNYFLHFYTHRTFIKRIFNKTADVLQNSLLYSEVKRKSLQNRLLVEIGKKISSTLHLNEVLNTIVDSISQLVSYDAVGIFLIDRKKNILKRQITRGYDEQLLDKLILKIDQGSYGWAIKNKKTRISNNTKHDPYYYMVRPTTRSQVSIPLLNGDEVIGILALESDRINHFTKTDVEFLETFASQAAIAIENAQLFEESLQRKRLESELVVASKIQKALLPDRAPYFPGFQISFLNLPSRIVSGDLIDIFRSGKNSLSLAIGDVSGKGAPASILMAVLYAGFKSVLKEYYPVVEVIARLNNQFSEVTAEGYYASFFYGVINGESKQLTYTNAGHNPPILLHKDLSYKRLQIGGIVLGFLQDQEYRQDTIQLNSGDYLILFTDGVTEVKNSQGVEFGEKRLINFIKKNYGKHPTELKNDLVNQVKQFCSNKELPDDFTLAIVYVE